MLEEEAKAQELALVLQTISGFPGLLNLPFRWWLSGPASGGGWSRELQETSICWAVHTTTQPRLTKQHGWVHPAFALQKPLPDLTGTSQGVCSAKD